MPRFSMVYWTEGKKKKARVVLGDLDLKNYKILVSSPIVEEPNLVAYHPSDDYIYFTDIDGKTVKKVKPSAGEIAREP